MTGQMNQYKAHRRTGQPQKMGDVLASLMASRGYARVISSASYEQAWQEAAGRQLAGHSRPGSVHRGVLEVTVRNSAVMQELAFRKTQLLAQLTRLIPEEKIAELKFRVGAIE